MKLKFALFVAVPCLTFGVLVFGAGEVETMQEVYSRLATTSRKVFLVSQSRFSSPTNNWDPAQGEFPVDITAYANKAREHLAQKGYDSLELRGFEIQLARKNRLVPNPRGYGLKVAGADECWAIAFEFAPKLQVISDPKVVVMLMDGTVVEETLGEMPHLSR